MSLKRLKEVVKETTQCEKQISNVVKGLENSWKWALECKLGFFILNINLLRKYSNNLVVDTWGTPSKSLHGRDFSVGYFDECHKFSVSGLRGKYCTATTKVVNWSQPQHNGEMTFESFFGELVSKSGRDFKQGICVPQSCSAKEIKAIADKVMDGSRLGLSKVVCYEPQVFDSFDYVLLYVAKKL